MALAQISYTTVDSVKVKLEGKVRFQEDPAAVQNGELPDALLLQCIADAETQVEMDLRGRYAIPFRSTQTEDFTGLPDHSKRAIRIAVDLQAIMQILDTDFGRSGKIDASAYYKNTATRYDTTINKLLGIQEDSDGKKVQKRTPPLEKMKLAPGNSKADDGHRGVISNTDMCEDSAEGFALSHLNDPSSSMVRRRGGSW